MVRAWVRAAVYPARSKLRAAPTAPFDSRAARARCFAVHSGRCLARSLLDFFGGQGSQRDDHGARADRRQQFARIFGQQKNRGKLRRLLQHFQQRIGRLLHERRLGEDVNPLPGFARPVVNGLDHAPHLVHLDHHLRRIGRDHQHVGMGLDKQPRLFLVRLAQVLPGFDRLREAGIEILRLGDARRSWSTCRRSQAARR